MSEYEKAIDDWRRAREIAERKAAAAARLRDRSFPAGTVVVDDEGEFAVVAKIVRRAEEVPPDRIVARFLTRYTTTEVAKLRRVDDQATWPGWCRHLQWRYLSN